MNHSQITQGMLPSQVNDAARGLGQQMPIGDPSLWQRLIGQGLRPSIGDPRDMTAADLGIIDQNLDDKIGMEP